MVTFENGENYWIQFEISNNRPTFDSIQCETKNTIRTAVVWLLLKWLTLCKC